MPPQDDHGEKVVVVAHVAKVRELVYIDRGTEMTCTHLIVSPYPFAQVPPVRRQARDC